MGEEKIIIEIDEDGSVEASTSGFKGSVCMNELQEILGKNESFSSIKTTDEYKMKTARIVVKQKIQRK